ncbi:hypothetical protein [Tenuibacillus multivorans]|uniref:Uncharacterized protein n=1 Tax=Tenuibacillus multivorans TaxID=237069 RepID=A0A1H0BMN9_9BACI|nr:hypothetical protein [Tenuibacillus multivorans]GEL77107.1 hypothetical protein TMU01_13420 [Tenuibacillus multivorans]SDN46852.1 hypothetical protein SAMN05216498_2313 [Tenuibacillus multivorans]
MSLNATGTDKLYGPETSSKTVNGSITISGDVNGTVTIQNLHITGDLTIDTTNAHVELQDNVTIDGETNVVDVNGNSLVSVANHTGNINITDDDSSKIELTGNASSSTVNILSNGGDITLAGAIHNVIVSNNANITVDNNSRVDYLSVESGSVLLDAPEESVGQIVKEENAEVSAPDGKTLPVDVVSIVKVTADRLSEGDTKVVGVEYTAEKGSVTLTVNPSAEGFDSVTQNPNVENGANESFNYHEVKIEMPEGAEYISVDNVDEGEITILDDYVFTYKDAEGNVLGARSYFPVSYEDDTTGNTVAFGYNNEWVKTYTWYDSNQNIIQIDEVVVKRESVE